MKPSIIAAASLASFASLAEARADVFAFKDLGGYEKCMELEELVETVQTGAGRQTRFLSQDEIQERCVASATKLVAKSRKKDMALDFINATKRLSSPERAFDLIGVLVEISLPACNELSAYEVLMRPLTQGWDNEVSFAKAKPIIKRCLKDSDFRKDFLEEKDSEDPVRSKLSCQILLEEKLVKACKGGKP